MARVPEPVKAVDKRAIYVRVTPGVYAVLEAAARAGKRSMSAEAELRIEAAIASENGGRA